MQEAEEKLVKDREIKQGSKLNAIISPMSNLKQINANPGSTRNIDLLLN